MATAPFGALLETALKLDCQGGVLTVLKDRIVAPRFFCCTLGADADAIVGVAKDPVALLIVSPTRVCAGDNVNADYSHSWSSSSTIQSWIIDWGDGNSTSGVWAGPGNVNHPDGGYAIPATYTITLTVTDLLGATGEDTQQVEVIDCLAGPPLGLFAGCGDSGVWYSGNAGISWDECGGGVLEGVRVYDLKVHPFSLGLEENELWAATVNGLYRSTDSGTSWIRIVLPEPVGGHGYPSVAAIAPSKIAAQEVFVVCHGTVEGCAAVWLYRTTDSGITWTWVEVRACGTTAAVGYVESKIYGGQSVGKKFAVYGGRLYTLDKAMNSHRLGVRSDVARTWAALPGMGIRFEHGIIAGDGAPYRLWVCGGQSVGTPGTHFQAWDGAAWATFDGNRVGKYDLIRRPDFSIATTDWADRVRVFDSAGAYVGEHLCTWYIPYGIYEFNGTLFVKRIVVPQVGRHLGGNNWAWEADSDSNGQFAEEDGILYTPPGNTRHLHVRDNATQTWSIDSVSVPDITDHGPQIIHAICEHNGFIYIGTSRGRIYRRFDSGYVLVGACSCDDDENDKIEIHHIINHRYEWLASCEYDINGTERRIYRLPGPTAALTVPAVGRTHIIDTDAYGLYVYLGLINEDGDPIIARVNSDLTDGVEIHEIYRTDAGTWGGVKCDYTNGGRVWIFGDFGATKVLISDDWGDNWTDVTDGSWAGNEVVRSVMPSIYDGWDIVATLNTDLEAWRSGDAGISWAKTGDLAFSCHCGERDWIEDMNVFIGRLNAVATHLQYSPNLGAGWIERSGGIVPNDAPITALQVVW